MVERAIQDAARRGPGGRAAAVTDSYRDECMAANVGWILDQAPKGSKVVLWAHNGHVARPAGAMGSFLDEEVRQGDGGRRLRLPRGDLHRGEAPARAS